MQEQTDRRSNRERSQTMRAELLAAARSLFVERGYADTSTPDIVSAAGVTRGALYHHFADKRALFGAVVEQEAAQVARSIDAAMPPGRLSPREALAAGMDAFLAAMRAHGRVRLLLIDGPAALGVATMSDIDARNGGATLREGLGLAFAESAPANPPPLAASADMLSAAADRAALAIDSGADPAPYRTALAALIDGLLAHP